MAMWIRGHHETAVWHLGRMKSVRGLRTGKVLWDYYVTACAGRTLGGTYGNIKQEGQPLLDPCCKACVRIAQRESLKEEVREENARDPHL